MTSALIVLTVLLPLVLFFTYSRQEGRARLAKALPLAALPGLLLALLGSDQPLIMPWLLEGSVWGLDQNRRVFLGFTSLVWMIAGLYALFYVPFSKRNRPIMLFWLLSMSGNLGLILAQDIVSFYTFFAVMTFASYGLIIHWRRPDAMHAGTVYIIMGLAGEMLLLAGLIIAAAPQGVLLLSDMPTAVATSAHSHWIMGLLITGFGVKAGLPLLHLWLPLSHMVAPTPASAVLSGVMIKAGLFGLLVTLPLADQVWFGWGSGLVITGLTGIFGGALLGFCQRTPKAVLAYSSISQMGIMTVMLGLALATTAEDVFVPALVFYALHHSLAKSALFLGAGTAPYAGALPRWLFWALTWLPGLSLSGLLFTSGAAAKSLLTDGLASLNDASEMFVWLAPLLIAAAVSTTLLMARFVWCLRDRVATADNDRIMPLCWILAVAASTLLPWFLPMPAVTVSFPPGLTHPLDYLFPTLAGLLIAASAWKVGLNSPAVPPGDLVVGIEWLWKKCRSRIRRVTEVIARFQKGIVETSRDRGSRLLIKGGRLLEREEFLLSRSPLVFVVLWTVALILLLL